MDEDVEKEQIRECIYSAFKVTKLSEMLTQHFVGLTAIKGFEISMQVYGNQRFNAALSEAIEKIDELEITHLSEQEVIEILEGLKK